MGPTEPSERVLDLEDQLAAAGQDSIMVTMGDLSFPMVMGVRCMRCGEKAIGREQRARHGLCRKREPFVRIVYGDTNDRT